MPQITELEDLVEVELAEDILVVELQQQVDLQIQEAVAVVADHLAELFMRQETEDQVSLS